jgi:hypothetical protein
MLDALFAGVSDPVELAELAKARLRAKIPVPACCDSRPAGAPTSELGLMAWQLSASKESQIGKEPSAVLRCCSPAFAWW